MYSLFRIAPMIFLVTGCLHGADARYFEGARISYLVNHRLICILQLRRAVPIPRHKMCWRELFSFVQKNFVRESRSNMNFVRVRFNLARLEVGTNSHITA
jgi:hypothetical protein